MRVLELWRYPVKSLQGERLDAVVVSQSGFEGDRRFALFYVETGFGLTARRVPELLFASARLTAEDPFAADLDAPVADRYSGLGVPEQRQRDRALAAPGLPDHPQDLTPRDLEADVIDHRFARRQRQRQRAD